MTSTPQVLETIVCGEGGELRLARDEDGRTVFLAVYAGDEDVAEVHRRLSGLPEAARPVPAPLGHGRLDDGRPYLCLSSVDGSDVDGLCASQGRGGRLAPRRALALACATGAALAACHDAGLVHGAIASRTVRVDRRGSPWLPSWYRISPDAAALAAGAAADVRSLALLLVRMMVGPAGGAGEVPDERELELLPASLADIVLTVFGRGMSARDFVAALRGLEGLEGVWADLAERAATLTPKPGMDLWETLRQRVDLGRSKPWRISEVEEREFKDSKGRTYYMLKNLIAGTYLKLGERDYFMWRLMDGTMSVRDIATAYFTEYGSLSFDGLLRLISELRHKQFFRERPHNVFGRVEDWFRKRSLSYRADQLYRAFFQKEFPIRNVDRFVTIVYRAGAWLLFTRPALIASILVALVGFALFLAMVAQGKYQLVRVNQSLGMGLVVIIVARQVAVVFHEMGHALAVKSYGRQVRKGGMMIYFGSPAFYMDTTDIWMEARPARILVSWAGPYTEIVVASLACILIYPLPVTLANDFLFKLAFLNYCAVIMNLNPLLELDGYYMLMDLLEIPRLRARAIDFVRTKLLGRLREARAKPFTREERIFAIYGGLSSAWSAVIIILVLMVWRGRAGAMITEIASSRSLAVKISLGLLLFIMLAPLAVVLATRGFRTVAQVLGRASKLLAGLRRRRRERGVG